MNGFFFNQPLDIADYNIEVYSGDNHTSEVIRRHVSAIVRSLKLNQIPPEILPLPTDLRDYTIKIKEPYLRNNDQIEFIVQSYSSITEFTKALTELLEDEAKLRESSLHQNSSSQFISPNRRPDSARRLFST